MPFLRVYSPELDLEQKRLFAHELTEGILRALGLPEQYRDRTAIHFVGYRPEEMAIGGRLAVDSQQAEYILEIVEQDLTQRKKEALVRVLTPLAARLFGLNADQIWHITMRFVSYSADDYAIGGRFVSEIETTSSSGTF
jgi:phenylpyruvate tautomerase PptA (4-oxalocrotonate tautomerase family)